MTRLRRKLKSEMKNYSNLKENRKLHFHNVEWDLFPDNETKDKLLNLTFSTKDLELQKMFVW